MKQKLNYWLISAIKGCLGLMVMTVVYSLVFAMIGSKIGSPKDLLDIKKIISVSGMTMYYMLMSIVVMNIWAGMIFPSTTNLVLSLGSTRKDAYKGMILYSAFSTVIFTIVNTLILFLQGSTSGKLIQYTLGFLGAVLMALGFGVITGAISMAKESKKGLAYFMLSLVGTILPLFSLFLTGVFAAAINLPELVLFSNPEIWTAVVLVIGAVVAVVGFIKMKKNISRHEVSV